jgi:hypothetical protein
MSDLCQGHGGRGFSLFTECPECRRERMLADQTAAIRSAKADAEARHRELMADRDRRDGDAGSSESDGSYVRPSTPEELAALNASIARTKRRALIRDVLVPGAVTLVGVLFGLIVTNPNAQGGKVGGAAVYGIVAFFLGRWGSWRYFRR